MDFAPEADIRALATQLLDRLFKEWLLFLTSSGYYYPVAGRNFIRHYRNSDFTKSIGWFLTGRGPILSLEDYSGSFLSTTTLDLEGYDALWEPEIYTKFTNGHHISRHTELHGERGIVEQTLYQWAAGLFLHPDYVKESDYVIDMYDLHDHSAYDDFAILFEILPRPLLFLFALFKPGNSRGTDRSLAEITLYKHHDIALTSLEDFNVGYRGGDQFVRTIVPCLLVP